MRSATSTLRHAAIVATFVIAGLPARLHGQTPTAATLTEWDIFAATGGDETATQNIASVFLDSTGSAGPAGSVWVTAHHPRLRLGRLNPAVATDNYLEWHPVTIADSAGSPRGLAVNRNTGDVWITMQGDPPILMKMAGTDTFRRFRALRGLTPDGVAVTADHAAIVALPGRNSLGVGDALLRVPRNAAGWVTASLWNVGGQPTAVAIDNAGDVWFAQRTTNIVARLDLGTGTLTEWTLPTGSNPSGLEVDGSLVCVVSEGQINAANGTVHCLDALTNQVTIYQRPASDGFDLPQRIAFNSAGESFVTELNANAVSFVSAAARATAITVTVTPAVRTVPAATTSLYAEDVAIAPVARSVAPLPSVLPGADDGRGYVRFSLPVFMVTYPFLMPTYPQPVGVSPVFNDRGPGTGAVYFGQYFDGPVWGLRTGARVGRLELDTAVSGSVLIANPNALRFDAVRGATPPAAQTVAITESSGASLNWTATEAAAWLSLSATTGVTPSSLSVSVVPGTLPAGTYLETIVVDDGPGGADPRSIDVTLNISDAPTITLTPATLAFAAVAGGTSPPAQWFSIENTGAGVLDWTATVNQPWVTLSRASGTAPSSVSVSVNPATLTPGTKTAVVTVASSAASNSPRTLTITVDVSNTGPQLSVAPASLAFAATKGGPAPAAQSLTVSNTGGGTIVWTASADATWLRVTPSSGTATPTASASLGVTVDAAALSRGTYTGTITVSDPAATGSPKTIAVSLTVTAATIGISPASLSFLTPVGSSPASQSLIVSNTGDAPLTFTPVTATTSGGNWLSVAPAAQSTIAPGGSLTLVVSIASGALGAATYNGSITVADPGATNSPIAIPVSLRVASGPFVGLAPASLTFSTLRGRNPASQTFTVSNSGNATLNFSTSVSDGGSWLFVTPSSGSIAPGGSMTLTAQVASSTLASGSYTASIAVADAAAANSPQTVGVSLTVTPAPTITLLPTTLTFTGARWTTCNGVESGQTVASQALTLGNSGDAALNYTAVTSGGTWLSVSPSSGSVAPGGTQQLSVAVVLAGLARGTYTGTVTVSDPSATNLLQTADVTLTVGNAAATLCVTPASMDFGTVSRNSTTSTQILQILNVGDEPMGGWNATWTASRGTVNLSSSSGSSPTSISVSVTTTNVRGSQTGTITITAAGAGSSPVTVNLTWTVQ